MSDNQMEPSSEDVQTIKNWLLVQPHLPNHLEEILIKRFIFSCKHSLQLTKETIDLYFTIRHHGSIVFGNRDPLAPEIKHAHTVGDVLVLPKVTKDNYSIIMNRLRDKDPDHYIYNDLVKGFFMLMDTRLLTEKELHAGEIHVMDSEGCTLKHISKWVLSTIKIYMSYTQEAMPIKLKQVHVMNCPSFIDKIIFILKPMMKEGIMEHIFFHPVGSSTLYNHIPQELLPNEYGGSAGTIDSIKYKLIETMDGMRDYFLDTERCKVDESNRPNGKRSQPINEGSFKTLSID